MIRTLGRDGRLARSVTAHPKRLRLRHPTHDAHLLLFSRLLTTPAADSKANSQETPVPLPSALRKPKLDLRSGPAPIKPAPGTINSKPPPIAEDGVPTSLSSETLQQVPPGTTRPEDMPQPEEPASGQGSVFQVMKRDIDDAMRVGILEPMPSDAGRVKQVWHSLKEVSKFYFRGVRQIWYNRVEVVALEKRVREGGSALTREETRFIRQYKQDAVKLIPFALTLLILEELIPLMVLYVPWMLPSTCILPSQGERMRLKAADKQRLYHARLRPDFEAIRARAAPATQIPVAALDTSGARALCGLLGLPEFGPALLRRRRLARHLGALAQDDALLRREGWGRQLVGAKLGDALHARGIPTRGLTAEEQELRLRYWLLESDKAPSVTAVEPDAVAKRVFLASTLAALRYTIALDAETKYPVLVPLDG